MTNVITLPKPDNFRKHILDVHTVNTLHGLKTQTPVKSLTYQNQENPRTPDVPTIIQEPQAKEQELKIKCRKCSDTFESKDCFGRHTELHYYAISL